MLVKQVLILDTRGPFHHPVNYMIKAIISLWSHYAIYGDEVLFTELMYYKIH